MIQCKLFNYAVFTLLLTVNVVQAEGDARTKPYRGFEGGVYAATDVSATLPYRLLIPKDYSPDKSYPLVLALHGLGMRGEDNQRQVKGGWVSSYANTAFQKEHPCFILAPQCPNIEGAKGNAFVRTHYNRDSLSLDDKEKSSHTKYLVAAFELLSQVCSEYSIDTSRLYITGNSMGGFSTWYVIQRWPGIFAAAVPCAGAGDPSHASVLLKTPIQAIHGDADPVVPYKGSVNMVEAIKAAGGELAELITVEGGNHAASNPGYKIDADGNGLSDVAEWMLAQRNSKEQVIPVIALD